MRVLASYVMRGRSQAVLMASLWAILSMLLTPVSILSSATVALVTLRRGEREALLVAGLATVGTLLLSLLIFRTAVPAFGFVLLLWLPAGLVGWVLRASRSLALAVEAALVLGLLVIAFYYVRYADPVAGWEQLLEPVAKLLVDSKAMTEANSADLVRQMARWMTGVLAAGYFLQTTLALLMARWWQAYLYNPGGFRDEFHGLRLHRVTAYAALPFLVAAIAVGGEGGNIVSYVAVLFLAAYFLQGLGLAHGLVRRTGSNSLWLGVMYVLLLIALPQMMVALAVAGYADAWLDFRSRFGRDDQ